ncbi:MAG TPA: CU044_5270 family protein [Candidatus Limnocylindrales bacterium]
MNSRKKLMRTLAQARPPRLDPVPGQRPDPAAIMAHPVPGQHPDPAGNIAHPRPQSTRRRRLALATTMADPQPSKPARRPARRLALAGLGAALAGLGAAAVVVVAVSLHGGGPGAQLTTLPAESAVPVPVPQPQTARDLLLVAANRSASTPATGGKYLVVTVEHGERRSVGPATRPYDIMLRSSLDRWYPTAPDGTFIEGHQSLGARPATDEDVAAWRADGSPAQWTQRTVVISSTPGPRTYTQLPKEFALSSGGWPSAKELAELPADPAAMRQWLQDAHKVYSGDKLSDFELFRTGESIASNPLLPPRIQAAAFRMLAGIDGVTVIGQVEDQQGRTGTAVGFARMSDGGVWSQSRLIIDPRTGQRLASESWALGSGKTPAATGELLGYQLAGETRYTDEAPPAVTPRR